MSDTSTGTTGETNTVATSTHPTNETSTAMMSETSGGEKDTTTKSETGTAMTIETSTTPSGEPLPEAAILHLSFSQVKQFDFNWSAASGADYYQLLESIDGTVNHEQIATDIVGESVSVTMPLHFRFGASYILRACNGGGCTDSEPVDVVGSMAAAVGYFKASSPGAVDLFGYSIAVSADGNTLAVGAYLEDSAAAGIGGNSDDNSVEDAGATYVFARSNNAWLQQAYIKASNTGMLDHFGTHVAVSADGNILVVGANGEDSAATGVGGNQGDNLAKDAGAAYVFVRSNNAWSQQAYVKSTNTGTNDNFGNSITVSADGNTLAIGAYLEDSATTGIGGDQTDNSAQNAGAVYVFTRANSSWSYQAYVKASNTGEGDNFGVSLAVSADGNTLAIGAYLEDSAAVGIGGDQGDNSAKDSGAVYVFLRSNNAWSQQAYVKASNTGTADYFGKSVALSADGNTLAVGAVGEGSAAIGVDGIQNDNSAANAGAAYVFVRSRNDWSQQAYVKASNTGASNFFGESVALSGDGNTLGIGAYGEEGATIGINGNHADNLAPYSGCAFIFKRSRAAWAQQAYAKASNTEAGDNFGISVAISADANTLAVGGYAEDSSAPGIGGDQAENSLQKAGAVYLF